jgi:hypothetical protein
MFCSFLILTHSIVRFGFYAIDYRSTVVGSEVQVSEKTVSLRDSPEAGLTKSGFFLFNSFRFRGSDQSVLVAMLRVRPQDLRFSYFPIKSRTQTSGEDS